MAIITAEQITDFRTTVRRFYRKSARKLPFRETDDPYAITVSEIMLQQTQVERVVPKYINWLKKFPNWQSLAETTNKEVLSVWSGLGYNRRALYLKKMALQVMTDYNGVMPQDIATLQNFPGIGRYTASAVAVFAFGKKVAAVDTNIRKVLLYTFNLPSSTADKTVQALADQVLPNRKIREWHYALMDYAKTLPQSIHRKYPPKTKQTRFEGSLRQVRGEIIRQLTESECITYRAVSQSLNRPLEDIKQAAEILKTENIITINKNKMYLIEN